MALELEMKKLNDAPVLAVAGRIVDIDVKKFAAKLQSVCKGKTQRVIVDMSQVNFIDSHGLGNLVYFHTLLKKENRELIVLNTNQDPNSYVRRLFEMTNLNKVITIVGSAEELQ